MLPLKVESLTVSCDSLTIGKHHRDILLEKLDEFTKFLHQRRLQLEEEYRTFARRNDFGKTSNLAINPQVATLSASDAGYDMRRHFQQELDVLRGIFQQRLDYLFKKFEMEWKADPREKTTKFPLPKSGTEALYLGEQLGDALGRGLAEICVQRPTDPIEYLALWLKRYSDNMRREKEDAVMSLKLRLLEEEAMVIREKEELLAREREQIKEDEERRRRMFLEQAREIEEAKQASAKPNSQTRAGDVQEGEDEEGHLVGATKRVTLVEPESSPNLYTIDEKDSINGVAEDNED